jgi:hypothetical protein
LHAQPLRNEQFYFCTAKRWFFKKFAAARAVARSTGGLAFMNCKLGRS